MTDVFRSHLELEEELELEARSRRFFPFLENFPRHSSAELPGDEPPFAFGGSCGGGVIVCQRARPRRGAGGRGGERVGGGTDAMSAEQTVMEAGS